jgi:colanic acid/amylovoran biosynthesis glycosyltransferase
VNFLGFLDSASLQEKMCDYHFFLHPSRTTASGDREGIPNSMLEAMAAGLIVFATRHSGIPEAVQHGENGILIEHATGDSLEQAIIAVLDVPTSITAMTTKARTTVIERFSSDANRLALEDIYCEAIQIANKGLAA